MTEREALNMALQALETLMIERGSIYDKAITAIKEALAQPEQEPVAWRNAALRLGEDLCSVGPFGYYDMTAEQWLDWALSVVTVHAPPPQRTWVGLTDVLDFIEEFTGAERERHPMFSDGYDLALSHVKELVEAKLKEKNT